LTCAVPLDASEVDATIINDEETILPGTIVAINGYILSNALEGAS
jgi:hypothetical protein